MLPQGRDVMGEENRIEGLGKKRYRSLGKMFEGPVRYTIWSQSPADLEIPGGFLKFVRILVNLGSLAEIRK
jgi:hypothetical protein